MHPPPTPKDAADAARWEVTARRVRLLTGQWLPDAEEWIAGWFAAEIVLHLPRPEMSRNPLLNLTNQIGTLYDGPYRVGLTAGEGRPTRWIGSVDGELLAQQQELLAYVLGCNDCALRIDVDPDDGRVSYRVVTTDTLVGEPDPKRPDQLGAVEELRPRVRPDNGEIVWTWERWSVLGGAPEFRIYTRTERGEEEDLTALFAGAEGWPRQYPAAGGVPYVMYHRRVAPRLWTPEAGAEVVAGTLTTSALWTAWLAGYRDGGFPARALIDGRIEGGTVERSMGVATKAHVLNPMAILNVRSSGEARQAALDQWAPALDPKVAGEAAADYEAGLASMMGLSPADVTRSANGSSGYAVVVSKSGQRAMQAKLRVPMGSADRVRLAKVAAYTGSGLPVDPEAWVVRYAPVHRTPEEVAAAVAEVEPLLRLGLISRVEAYMRVYPDATEEEAAEAVSKAAAERAKEAPGGSRGAGDSNVDDEGGDDG